MLEQDSAFGLIQVWRVGTRQTFVQRILDGNLHLRPRLLFLPPVQDQSRAHPCQQLSRDLLHFRPVHAMGGYGARTRGTEPAA
jgi:hypothetical protein